MPRCPFGKAPSPYLQRFHRLRAGFKSYGLRFWRRKHFKLERHLSLPFKQRMAQRSLLSALSDTRRSRVPFKFDFSAVQSVLSGPDPDYSAVTVYPMQAAPIQGL